MPETVTIRAQLSGTLQPHVTIGGRRAVRNSCRDRTSYDPANPRRCAGRYQIRYRQVAGWRTAEVPAASP